LAPLDEHSSRALALMLLSRPRAWDDSLRQWRPERELPAFSEATYSETLELTQE